MSTYEPLDQSVYVYMTKTMKERLQDEHKAQKKHKSVSARIVQLVQKDFDRLDRQNGGMK